MSLDFLSRSNMANRNSRPDGLDLYSGLTKTRSLSIGSLETMSNPSSALSTGTGFGSPLVGVSPEPAYIAASAASQIVTTDHEAFFQNLFDEGFLHSGNFTVLVSPQSLKLVNQFLDYLLWSFLSASRATSLKHLRPAVSEVLRSRLAREAINGAEAELEEYLGGSEDEELSSPAEQADDFDLERVWKRARLRCMVYSSLGDLEEDDEDAYAGSDYPDSTFGSDQYSRQGSSGTVSPAVAIWLTSILEFVGEQTLLIAGHATVARFSQARLAVLSQKQQDDRNSVIAPLPDRPVVEELDAEKVALNPVLGRMWRQWRKGVRSPGSIRAPSREAHLSRRTSVQSVQSVQSSIAPYEERDIREERKEKTLSMTAETPTPTQQQREQHQTEIVQDLAVSKALEHGLSAPPRNPLRWTEDEKVLIGASPLTPILETPTVTDPEGRKRLTLTLGSEIAEDGGTFRVPQPDNTPRPTSMISLPARPSHFVFPFSAQKGEAKTRKRELSPDMKAVKRSRSNSLPLPGAFPFGPEEVDFLRPKSAEGHISRDISHREEGAGEQLLEVDEVPDVEGERTPISKTIPRFPEPGRMRLEEPPLSPGKAPTEISELTDLDETDLEVESGTSHGVVRISTAQSLTISTPITPEIVSAQSSRRASQISTPRTPMERSESKDTEIAHDHIPENGLMEEEEEEDMEDPTEIGVARTSDVFVPPPQSLPTPVASPISPITPAIIVEKPSRMEDNESRKSTDRRISQYYNPAPVPSAPDFFPEHHTEREIEDYHRSRIQNQRPSANTVKSRDSPRSSLEQSNKVGRVDSKKPPKMRSSPTPSGIQAAIAAAEAAAAAGVSVSPPPAPASSDVYIRRGSPTALRAIERRTGQSVELSRAPSQQAISPVPPVQPDRAGVRVWTPPATPDISEYARKGSVSSKGHAKASNGSGSISSQTSHKLKSIMTGGRPQTAEGRASSSRQGSDSDSVRSESQNTTRDEKEKSFDQLINSGATLQYTLTPDNLKKMEIGATPTSTHRYSAAAPTVQRVGTADLADFLKETGPEGATPTKSTAPTRSSSLSKSRGPRVVPRETKASADPEGTKEISNFLRDTRPGQIPGKVSGVSAAQSTYPKGEMAPNTTKFSNIIRSTEAQVSPAKPTGLTNGRAKHPVTAAKESPRTPMSPTGIFPIIQQNHDDEIAPVVKSGSSPKPRLLAREASGTGETTSALIDFFRNTTPPANEQSPPRISRNVAPFRTTMDSAKFDPGRDALRSPVSQPSSPEEMSAAAGKAPNSNPSSYASHTELLKRNEAARREDLGKLQQLRQPPTVNSAPMPERKQTRVRDPYAIESDDEYEEEIYGTPKPSPGRRAEESLMDFLRNASPPPPTPTIPESPSNQVHKKSSALSLMSRFGRSPGSSRGSKKRKDSISSVSTAATAGTTATQSTLTSNHNNYKDAVKTQRFGAGNPPNSAHGSIAKSIPIRINTPTSIDMMQPTQSFRPPPSRDIATPSSSKSVPRRLIAEARDARATSESSDGLADFLRYTGPQADPRENMQSQGSRDDFRKMGGKNFLRKTNKAGLAN